MIVMKVVYARGLGERALTASMTSRTVARSSRHISSMTSASSSCSAGGTDIAIGS
jgi:hypothetical protein